MLNRFVIVIALYDQFILTLCWLNYKCISIISPQQKKKLPFLLQYFTIYATYRQDYYNFCLKKSRGHYFVSPYHLKIFFHVRFPLFFFGLPNYSLNNVQALGKGFQEPHFLFFLSKQPWGLKEHCIGFQKLISISMFMII